MKKVREITVFTNGDSRKISTWSNVPFFFTETLISNGLRVNRVDLSPSPFLEKLFYKTVHRMIKKIYKDTTYDYFRSLTNFIDVRNRIKKAVKKYPNSDAYIFLTFSFSSVKLTKKPTILFGDWTYQHYFNYFLDRKPDFFEKQCIARENAQIESSKLVFSLFPQVAEHMKNSYKNKEIHYLGNVINSLHKVPESEILQLKEESKNLLFVGSEKYIEGAKSLINAFKDIKQNDQQLSLHIIGMSDKNFDDLPENVYCYGYLDKGKENERQLYYKLFREAKIFINTTPKWSAFSATIEAMYFFTPVIVTPYDEFQKTFGNEIEFGCYCEENTSALIKEKIYKILNSKNYISICKNSHISVQDFTWQTYINKIIEKIENLQHLKINI
jgi:glycosyltransferase involved in cell wall biosynthesis